MLVLAVLAGVGLPDLKDLLKVPDPPAPLACVGPDEPHTRVAYVHDVAKPSRHAANASKIGDAVEDANRVFQRAGVTLAVRCGDDGRVLVEELSLRIEGEGDRYAALHAALPCEGPYKWLVAYDGGNGTSLGSAAVQRDARPDPEVNLNNRPCGLAVVWGASGAGPYAHELVHSLGANLDGSPNSDGNGHVTDGGDVLNGGRTLDTGKDDYFNLDPAPGSYLDTHWNVARSSYIRVL